jgi:type I restriction-modification system DNA methylase subunit
MAAKPVDTPEREFQQIFRSLCERHDRWRVFADFCELSAMALANQGCKDQQREERYLETVKRYSREEAISLSDMLACVMAGLDRHTDFLGRQFIQLELANADRGQVFTPTEVARFMAAMIMDAQLIAQKVREQGFVTLHEPAAGAGANIIAFAGAMSAAGFDPTKHLHVTAIEIDTTVAYMCYVQLSILGIPAVVYVGDTLAMEMREELLTPALYRILASTGGTR